MANLVQEMSKFGDSCIETQILIILISRRQKCGNFCPGIINSSQFEAEFSPAKVNTSTKVGLANGAMLGV